MYQFCAVTERMRVMHERTRERLFHVDSERSRIVTKAYQKYESVIPPIRNALIFKAMCEEMTTRVEDHEMLVANNTRFFCGVRLDPRWGGGDLYVSLAESGKWTMGEDGLYHNPPTDELRLVMAPEDFEALRDMRDYWKGRTIGDMARAWQPEGYDELNRLGVRSFGENMPIVMMPAGHSTPGYGKILRLGYAALQREARDWLDAHRNDLMGGDVEKSIFYSSVEIVCEGAMTLLRRYGAVCRAAAEDCNDPVRAAELRSMGDDGLYHNPPTDELRLVMSPEDLEGLRSVRDYWKGRTIEDMAQAWQPEGYEELNRLGVRSFGENMPIVMMPAGHSTPGYKKLLSTGYAALRQQARD